jgi:hypothetical protein
VEQSPHQDEVQRDRHDWQQEQRGLRAAFGALGLIRRLLDNNPQIAPQIAIELDQIVDRYEQNPAPNINLRIPVPLGTWNQFVEACGQEGHCTETATSLMLQVVQEYINKHNNTE